MNVYQDITLLPSAETNLGFLWQKVYTQVHLALVDTQHIGNTYAVAFPGYKDNIYPLGDKLRVFSTDGEAIERLALTKWLSRLNDYICLAQVNNVPEKHEYMRFYRKQFKSNVERLARRRAKRNSETYDQALAYFEGFKEERTKLPYVQLQSLSNEGRYFPLYIDACVSNMAVEGQFDCYGLSKTGTVPWF